MGYTLWSTYKKRWENPQVLLGKLPISMIFNSELLNYQRGTGDEWLKLRIVVAMNGD